MIHYRKGSSLSVRLSPRLQTTVCRFGNGYGLVFLGLITWLPGENKGLQASG